MRHEKERRCRESPRRFAFPVYCVSPIMNKSLDNRLRTKLVRGLLFALFVTLLVSTSLSKATSAPLERATVQPARWQPPVFLAPRDAHTYYLPFVARAPYLDLAVTSTEVIQGSTLSSSYALYIADRPATVRAYVSVTGASTASNVTGRMHGYYGSTYMGFVDSNTMTAPSLQSSMDRTLNFGVPSSWLQPGYSYSIQVDPNGLVGETNESNNWYPTDGSHLAYNFQVTDALQVVIVPILYLPYGASQSTLPYGAEGTSTPGCCRFRLFDVDDRKGISGSQCGLFLPISGALYGVLSDVGSIQSV